MKYKKLFGDMFIIDNLVFRIYDNNHPKNKIIAYPIYTIKKNHISKLKNREETIKKYLVNVGENMSLPIINENKIEKYFSCFDFKIRCKDKLEKNYFYIRKRLNKIGITKIGITGSNYLRLKGFTMDNKNSDLDLIILGKKESNLLKKNKDKIYDSKFVSYKEHVKKIYSRRRNKSSPFFIDLKTAKEFEAIKPIGIIDKTHVNITPTYRIKIRKINFKNKKNLGIINTKIEIKGIKRANIVPGFYKIKCKYGKRCISRVQSNFFFYLLGAKKGDIFNIKGNLIMEKNLITNKYYLELNSWGKYKEYFMNKIN